MNSHILAFCELLAMNQEELKGFQYKLKTDLCCSMKNRPFGTSARQRGLSV